MIEREEHEGILRLTLARGKANALDAAFLNELTTAVREAEDHLPRGLILSSTGNIFSAGLDLPGLLALDRGGMVTLLRALGDALETIFSFPRPTVAAINGHAIAGGALLTLACDLRYMAQGDGKWGLNEIALGLSMPAFAIELIRYVLERPVMEKILYGGALYPTYKAADMGIVDELLEAEQLLSRAEEAIVNWTASPHAFADIKARLHEPTRLAMQAARSSDDLWLDQWFSETAQQRLTAALARLQGARVDVNDSAEDSDEAESENENGDGS